MTPSMTARMSVRRLPPPGFAGGMWGSTCAHSSSVRSLGYLRWSRLYLARFLCVHIGGLPSNQAATLESQPIQRIQQVLGRTLTAAVSSKRLKMIIQPASEPATRKSITDMMERAVKAGFYQAMPDEKIIYVP